MNHVPVVQGAGKNQNKKLVMDLSSFEFQTIAGKNQNKKLVMDISSFKFQTIKQQQIDIDR